MTTLMAVRARAGLLSAAAVLVLIGWHGARAEDAPNADKKLEAPVAQEGSAKRAETTGMKPEAPAKAASKMGAGKDAEAKSAAAAESTKASESKASKSETSEPKPAATAGNDKKTKDAATAKTEPDNTTSSSAKADTTKADTTADKSDAADKDEAANKADAGVKGAPATTAALPDASAAASPASSGSAAGVSDQVLPPADAIVADVRRMIPDATRGANADDVAALASYYEDLNGPAIWVSSNGLTSKGKAVVAEIGKADDWGLRASDFDVPHLAEGTITTEAAAQAELKVARAVLKYARYARGGRINPSSISQLMDQSPTLKAPRSVLTEIATADAPDAYLRSLHPQHEQFKRLRQLLLKLRGSDGKDDVDEPEEDPALSVKIPPGRLLRGGMEDPQVSLLRKRLSVPADDPARKDIYDDKLQAAVRNFQRAKGLRPDALVGNNTRAVLNGRPKPVAVSSASKIERILINMERWRWVPEDLGEFYVWDNVPEALTRIVKNGKVIHTDKIIVGQPSWPTPIFSADMKTVVFHPSWGVPDGIKRKELLPLLRKSSGAGFFGIFGGGYSSQAVLDAYQLKAYYNGRQIDPNQVDWNSVNIAAYSFQQPPGPKNVLGEVKFLFPNKHDVYMHDTPERHLFSRSPRNFSHGCMRIADPHRFAEVILAQDKGWSAEKVRAMFRGYSNTVALDTHIPVHVTYFTAHVDDNGKLRTYSDFYGLDSRTAAALSGRPVRFQQPSYQDDEVASSDGAPSYSSAPPRQYNRKKQYHGPPSLADAISDIFSP